MSYCVDYLQKFKREGNFCGLDKGQVSRLNGYANLLETLEKQQIPEDVIINNFTVGAATPLLPVKDERRTDCLNYIVSQLKTGKKVTAGQVRAKLQIYNKPVTEPQPAPATTNEKLISTNLVDVPAAPIAPILKEKYNGQAEQHQPTKLKPSCMGPLDTFECCPDGKIHIMNGGLRGRICSVIGVPCNQLPRDECPIEVQTQKEAIAKNTYQGTGFTTASALLSRASPEIKTISLLERDDLTLTFVKTLFTQKQIRILDDAIKTGEFDSYFDVISGAIDRIGERMEERS